MRHIMLRRQRGMTLIELMLAMVVVASIILYFSVSIKNKTQERQLQQTSVEMQTILQAATSYYVFQQNIFNSTIAEQNIISNDAKSNLVKDLPGYSGQNMGSIAKSFWPTSTSDLIASGQTNSFLDTQWQLCSSWPSIDAFQCPMDGSKAGYFLDQTSNYLGVGIVMPTPNLALKLAAKLPGGFVDPDDNEGRRVLSYIPRPSGHYNPPMLSQKCNSNNTNCSGAEIVGARGWIASAGAVVASDGDPVNAFGWVNNSTKARAIVLPNCPAGYEGHYIMSFMRVQTGNCVSYNNYERNKVLTRDRPMYWNMMIYPDNPSSSNYTSIPMSDNMGTFFDYRKQILGSGPLSPLSPISTDQCWNYLLNLSGVSQNFGVVADTGYMVQYFTTMCVPNKHWFVHLDAGSEQLCNKKGFFGQNFLGVNHAGYVTQCQDTWPQYNPGTATAQCPAHEDGC